MRNIQILSWRQGWPAVCLPCRSLGRLRQICFLFVAIAPTGMAAAEPPKTCVVVNAGTSSSLRGLSLPSANVIWTSGTGATFLLSKDGGTHWRVGQIGDDRALDFRGIWAFNETTAFAMSSGEGEKSAVFFTQDGGEHWRQVLKNPDAEGFFDAIAFWSRDRGILLGDPVEGRFTVFTTKDGGESWKRQRTPEVLSGEAAFAASNSTLEVRGDHEAWFGSGGAGSGRSGSGGAARLYHSTNDGASWDVEPSPLAANSPTSGVFSVLMPGKRLGFQAGGDFKEPNKRTQTFAFSTDGGLSWQTPVQPPPSGYRSAVAIDGDRLYSVGINGLDWSDDRGKTWRQLNPMNLNAIAAGPGSLGVWAVGPKGSICKIPR